MSLFCVGAPESRQVVGLAKRPGLPGRAGQAAGKLGRCRTPARRVCTPPGMGRCPRTPAPHAAEAWARPWRAHAIACQSLQGVRQPLAALPVAGTRIVLAPLRSPLGLPADARKRALRAPDGLEHTAAGGAAWSRSAHPVSSTLQEWEAPHSLRHVRSPNNYGQRGGRLVRGRHAQQRQ